MFSLNFLAKRFNHSSGLPPQKLNAYQLLSLLVTGSAKSSQQKLGPKVLSLGPLPSAQATPQQFSTYILALYNLLLKTLGSEIARKVFESELQYLKVQFGQTEEYLKLLKILPIPVMGTERLTTLSRQELENELLWRIKELEDIQTNLESLVQQRTQTISAERNKLVVTLSAISDAVIAVDLNRQITIFNSAAEILTGYIKKEALGQPINQVMRLYDKQQELTPEQFCPLRLDGFEGIVASKQSLKLVGKAGKESFANLLSGQIREGPAVNLGCILTLHDVTREKDLEEMKLDFVSMAAHELRTPLTSIRGYLSVFMQENAQNLNGEQNMLLGRINTAAQQLMGLIENLLSVSKIERGAFTVSFEPIDWLRACKSVVEEFKPRAEEKKQTLEFLEPSEPMPTIEADKLRINEVLSNLIANAISYTPEGGQITVWTESQDGEVITHVKDTGVGIQKEAIPHLFTKFFRISGNLEQGSKGTGLGLYISKSVVDMHHGKIWVESEFGKGSTFNFSLPISQQTKSI